MARGRKPTPTHLLEKRGSWRAKTRPAEPQPERAAPNPPTWLSREAAAEWRRIVPELEDLNLLAKIDRAMLATYCESWAQLVRALQHLANEGEVIDAPNGFKQANPWLRVANDARKAVQQFGAEFGLSPSSRPRIAAPPPPADCKDKRFFPPKLAKDSA